MAFDHRDMSGTMFRNDKKTSDKQPDYRGECKVNGKILAISCWVKEGKKGKFFSLAFSEPRQHDQDSQTVGQRWDGPPSSGGARAQDDVIPFAPCKL